MTSTTYRRYQCLWSFHWSSQSRSHCNYLRPDSYHEQYFTFNGNHYLQLHGTGMGTNIAPSFTFLFESKTLGNAPSKPHTWLRYIDDILKTACTPIIRFTSSYSSTNTSFLDVKACHPLHTIVKFCWKNATHNRDFPHICSTLRPEAQTNPNACPSLLNHLQPNAPISNITKKTPQSNFFLSPLQDSFPASSGCGFQTLRNLQDLQLNCRNTLN